MHGVLSYAVGLRRHELGIRGALGATRWGIERMVLADAARLAAVGLILGLPGAALGSKLIERMLYGTSRLDLPVYLMVTVSVVLIALAAGYLPARKAARVDPLVVLRGS